MRQTIKAFAALAALCASLPADTVVLSTQTIECKVVSSDSVYTRIRLPSGGIMMLYTDSIRVVRYTDSISIPESKPPSPQAGVSVGVSPTVPSGTHEPLECDAFSPATPLVLAGETGAGCLGGLALTLPVSLLGAAVGEWMVGDSANFPDRLFGFIDGSNIGALVGYAAGSALGASVVGLAFDQGGHPWASACGATAGALAGAAWFSVDTRSAKPSAIACVLLPMVGAVLGYNLSRPGPSPASSFLDRVEMPAVTLWRHAEKQVTGVDVRLICVRF